MNKQNYDIPVLQMIRVLNDHVGSTIDMPTLRDEWYFKMSETPDNNFIYWLDLTMELIGTNCELVYIRQRGWYTEVEIKVCKITEL
tara:strand:- start:689 stop:946 length:258 start_codon:yes stop_codon:yes gene_type:complete